MSKQWRKENDPSQLLLATINPHEPVVSSTVSGWLLKLLKMVGINTDTFKAHSTRSAASSKAREGGLPIAEILKRGCWSGSSTWQARYNNDIVHQGRDFQHKVYSRK